MDNKTLISIISGKTGRDEHDISLLISKLGDIIAEKVKDGDTVSIPGFGGFESKMRMERVSTHPSSGKKILIPPKISVIFKPSALMKQKLKGE